MLIVPVVVWQSDVYQNDAVRSADCRRRRTVMRCSRSFDGSRTLRRLGHKTFRHRDTSAPQNWCRSLSRITGGAMSHRNCPGSKCPGFSSITALVSKCLVPRFWCQSVLRPVPKCPRVSWCRSALWQKCPVTQLTYDKIIPRYNSLLSIEHTVHTLELHPIYTCENSQIIENLLSAIFCLFYRYTTCGEIKIINNTYKKVNILHAWYSMILL